jgi:hypothetical protein
MSKQKTVYILLTAAALDAFHAVIRAARATAPKRPLWGGPLCFQEKSPPDARANLGCPNFRHLKLSASGFIDTSTSGWWHVGSILH